ncbi:MAG: DUF692 family multinuclear iron-containing protein [Saprospiraceae bacterium]
MQAALSLNLDSALLRTSMPLLQAGEVDAVEWSFDAMGHLSEIPTWWTDLLDHYGKAGRLVGHGVFFSLFDGRWRPEQDAWLSMLQSVQKRFGLQHVTEHFGFMSGADFHKGAPLSVPMTARTLRLGHDRLARLQDAAGCPVGLENLALAYSATDVARQGEFLQQLVEPTDGFIILDLHNLYCQAHNFDVDPLLLIHRYPLDRVLEFHISGGSWEASVEEPGRTIRRDTHDGRVPEEVFGLLEAAIALCPQAKVCVFEQMSTSLVTKDDGEGFRSDFRRMRALLPDAGFEGPLYDERAVLTNIGLSPKPLEDEQLFAEQRHLVDALATADTVSAAQTSFRESGLDKGEWQTDTWDCAMVETAMRIVKKWA